MNVINIRLISVLLLTGLITIYTSLAFSISCDSNEFPSLSGNLGYKSRDVGSPRCEGTYTSKISSGFEILSFTRDEIKPQVTDTLYIKSAVDFKIPVTDIQIIGKSISSDFYFRMDSSVSAKDEFVWPMDIVKKTKQLNNNIGIYGRTEINSIEFIVPLTIKGNNKKNKTDNGKKLLGRLVIRTFEGINTIYVFKQGDEDNSSVLINNEYDARAPINIDIPDWSPQNSDDGVLQIEIQLKPADSDDVMTQSLRILTSKI